MTVTTIYPELKKLVNHAIEVVDENNRPLMVMPVAGVHEQQLKHRVILTLLYNAEGRVYLQRRARTKKTYPGMWDLSSTGHVQAGESLEDAALRELEEELNVYPGKVALRKQLEATPETDNAWITLFVARLGGDQPRPNPDEVEEGIFVDKEELAAMFEHFREMLTPAVIWACEEELVFP